MSRRKQAEKTSPPGGDFRTVPTSFAHIGDSGTLETAFYVVLLSPAREQYCDFPLIANPSVLGREPGHAVVVRRDDISRQHAELIRRGTQWHLGDLNSTNGTYINGERVIGTREITPGTSFMLGNSEFVLLERDDPSLQRYRRYFNDRRHDPLTNLRNEDALRDAVRDASKAGGGLSLVMFEIDDFERVNSELGRERGDALLKEVADKLTLRVTAPIYRHRGPRFAVLRDKGANIRDEIRNLIDDVQNAVAASGFERSIRPRQRFRASPVTGCRSSFGCPSVRSNRRSILEGGVSGSTRTRRSRLRRYPASRLRRTS